MPIKIVDANNFVRRRFETTGVGSALVDLYRVVSNWTNIPAMRVIFVWDGPNGNARRRAIYPEYKQKRKGPKDPQLVYAGFESVQKLLGWMQPSVCSLKVPEYEADDVIVSLTQMLPPGEDCHIHTTDADLSGLGFPTDKPTVLGLSGNDLRLYKTLVGDPSDNIPGQHGFGPAAFGKLTRKEKDDWILRFELREGPDDLQAFWDIVGFFPVSRDLINKHLRQGEGRYDLIEGYFQQYMLYGAG